MNVNLGLREYIARCADRPAPSLEEPDVPILLITWQDGEGMVNGVAPVDVIDALIDYLTPREETAAVHLLRYARDTLGR